MVEAFLRIPKRKFFPNCLTLEQSTEQNVEAVREVDVNIQTKIQIQIWMAGAGERV